MLSGTVQLFACWDGDQTAPPEDQEIISPEYFGGESFSFKEKVLFYVQRETSAPPRSERLWLV
jgi:hypothetical protein